MAVRHLGEFKKKKKSYRARAEVGIHESTYVVGVHFSQPQRPGHQQTYAKSPRGSRGPSSLLPHPAAREARRPLSEGQPGRRRTPAGPRFHPGTRQANLPASRVPGGRTGERAPLPGPAGACPSPSCTGPALGSGARAAAPASRRSPLVPGLGLSPARQPPLRRRPPPHLPARP